MKSDMLKGQKLTKKRKSITLTEDHKRKISESHKGEKNYWFGKKLTEEHKAKLRVPHVGSGIYEGNKGRVPWNKGTKGIMKANQSSFSKGSQAGEKHHQWKGGISKFPSYNTFTTMRRRARKRLNDGTHTIIQWEELKKYYNFMCLCCKQTEPHIKLSEDHIVPLVKGGSDDISNIQPLCTLCNSFKNSKITDYRILFKIEKNHV